MKRIIIGVHGLGNKPDHQTLAAWWKSSITNGIRQQALPSPEFDFDMVYWANLLYEQALDLGITDKRDPRYITDPYLPIQRGENHEAHDSRRQKILDLLGNQLENIFLNKDLTINFSSVNDFVLRHFFKDLAVYYNTYHDQQSTTNEQKQQVIRAVLSETLVKHRKKKILLIAHSMGAIIAYDVLTQIRDITVDTFITIGCPLGLPTIRSKIAAEHVADNPTSILRTPESVTAHWYNFSDLRDKIALYYRLADDFSPNSKGVQVVDRIVTNEYQHHKEKNPHKSYGYLQTEEVSAVIQAFLTEKSPGWLYRVRSTITHWLSSRNERYN